jgi:ABC-2 type transport system ATP-binding protein
MNTVEVSGLRRCFDSLEALRDVSFSVTAGELCAVVGPDGAGKTTLARLLCGLLRPHGGQAIVLSHPLPQEARTVRRSVGYLSQGFTLYRDLTVDENLSFLARLHGVRDFAARREELLSFTRLAPFASRQAAELSGGMKKKLALAAALLHHPPLIVLDEPTTGVDPVSRRDFWVLLSRLRDAGVSILLTTPYLDEAERCDRVVMLHRGEVLDWDAPAALIAPLQDRVFELILADARRGRELIEHELGGSFQVQLFGDRLHLLLAEREKRQGILKMITAAVDAAGLGPAAVRPVRPRLENVFISRIRSREAP